jgi:hypothetical protein
MVLTKTIISDMRPGLGIRRLRFEFSSDLSKLGDWLYASNVGLAVDEFHFVVPVMRANRDMQAMRFDDCSLY